MRLSLKDFRAKAVLVALLLVAFGLRLDLAGSTAYVVDEDSDWIRLAETISLVPGEVHLPIRDRHPALPAYFIKLGSVLFGDGPIGYRSLSILAALLTIALAYQMALAWKGEAAALWTAALLAFNEFYLASTALALLDPYYFLFALAAAHFFCRFLRNERPRDLYLSGFLTGLAFLCYEIAVLLPAVFVVTLLVTPQRRWLQRKEPYLALAVFCLVISPDIAWNLASRTGGGGPLDYGDHASRFGGVGFSVQPFVFYGRGTLQTLYEALGWRLVDNIAEYPSMNSLFGVILLAGVAGAAFRFRNLDAVGRFLVVFFGLIFGFFMLMLPGSPRRDIDPTLWCWADVTLLPAVLLAGHWIAGRGRWMQWAVGGLVAVAALYATVGVVRSQLAMPRANVVFSPQFLDPADGHLREVNTYFQVCSFCEVESVELVGLRVWDGPRQLDERAASRDVVGAEIGVDDRSFRLRATQGGDARRMYELRYRITETSGRAYFVEGGRLPGIYVEPPPPEFRMSFWAPEDR